MRIKCISFEVHSQVYLLLNFLSFKNGPTDSSIINTINEEKLLSWGFKCVMKL